MRRAAVFLVAICVGCSGGGSGGRVTVPNRTAPLVVAAGLTGIEPAPVDNVSAGVDLNRIDLDVVDVVFEVTTPAGEAFSFDLITRGEANAGDVVLSVAHAEDDGATPVGGTETLAESGINLSASSAVPRDPWVDADGDGFVRVTVGGVIDKDQVIAVDAETPQGRTVALVCIRIGPPSPINLPKGSEVDYPGVLDQQTIYSSDSWRFGLPTVAVSGDRTSVVVYEGDRADPFAPDRYELRLQHEGATGLVTGGASFEASPDTGHWRDHEAAALFNVLALVHSGVDEMTLKLSFDRGATFGQTVKRQSAGPARLAQVAMALDYTIAVVYWRTTAAGASELMLLEGRPLSFDAGGSPTGFVFDAEQVIYRAGDVMPVINGVAWSNGGDLVVGYGFSSVDFPEPLVTRMTSEFRCAVRVFGESFTDHLVERDVIVARDPSVSIVGQGRNMTIFYAYEGRDGARLRTSADAGATWSAPLGIGDGWSYQPSVFARDQGGQTRVDLLFLQSGTFGLELHLRHWDDYGSGRFEDFRLTEAKITGVPGIAQARPDIFPGPGDGGKLTQISWFGYDATLDGDDVVIVYNEQTTDLYVIAIDGTALGLPFREGAPALPSAGDFQIADPPPLAPGLTEPVPQPDPDDMNQLRILRID